MKGLRALCGLGLAVALAGAAALAQESVFEEREFASAADERRYHRLIEELRCLVCQNQSIAESNADLAAQLRDQVHAMIERGESDQAIVGFMVSRYGDFVLFRPPVKPSTWLLWSAPFVLAAGGLAYLVVHIRRRSARGEENGEENGEDELERELDGEAADRLDQLLNRK